MNKEESDKELSTTLLRCEFRRFGWGWEWHNPLGRGAWEAIVCGGHKELDTTEQLTFSLFLTLFKGRISIGSSCFQNIKTFISVLNNFTKQPNPGNLSW